MVALRSQADRAKAFRDAVTGQLTSVNTEIQQLENEEALLVLVSELFRQLIDAEITSGVQAVEKLQTEGLQAVFPDMDLVVTAQIEVLRGKVSVSLLTTQKLDDGTVVEGLSNDAFGGALSTVQSVLMRVIVVLRRRMRPLLVMDESLPAFDSNYVHTMGQFLSQLCSRMGVDILLVTHNPALVEAADRAFKIVRKNGTVAFQRLPISLH